MLLQESLHGFGRVEASVIADQANLPAGVSQQQRHQEDQERATALGGGQPVGQLARAVVHASIHDLFLVLAGCRHLGLLADGRPHACQGGVTMNFHLVLEDQDEVGIVAHRFFFKVSSSFCAWANAVSSRLPFIVCLGRWYENPSWCRMRRNWSSLKEIFVCLFRCSFRRATDQTLKP